jgi:hypothetical protein
MNIEVRSAWPNEEHTPWKINHLSDMPVVVWLRRQWKSDAKSLEDQWW